MQNRFQSPQGVWDRSREALLDSERNRPGQDPVPAPEPDVPEDVPHCTKCGALLTKEDTGLHRKIINRNATRFLCKSCIAEHFSMTVEDCDALIEHYKKAGCVMFR